ncbi:hypothetical protein [Delftia phage PhiW-14]|uniref:Uncharacterized protein n=1 Tax=Delftia phage PhiW-14 TaxID=665032 RepID=C9DGF6_BPW14|nr:hypothetical protein DP-phiW-14_gp186 [Delftia phage PhiW-14]ACV50207.1 hypothetical protein [Delftia phage PhiW-14]
MGYKILITTVSSASPSRDNGRAVATNVVNFDTEREAEDALAAVNDDPHCTAGSTGIGWVVARRLYSRSA